LLGWSSVLVIRIDVVFFPGMAMNEDSHSANLGTSRVSGSPSCLEESEVAPLVRRDAVVGGVEAPRKVSGWEAREETLWVLTPEMMDLFLSELS
jgi:hypothetical protein